MALEVTEVVLFVVDLVGNPSELKTPNVPHVRPAQQDVLRSHALLCVLWDVRPRLKLLLVIEVANEQLMHESSLRGLDEGTRSLYGQFAKMSGGQQAALELILATVRVVDLAAPFRSCRCGKQVRPFADPLFLVFLQKLGFPFLQGIALLFGERLIF